MIKVCETQTFSEVRPVIFDGEEFKLFVYGFAMQTESPRVHYGVYNADDSLLWSASCEDVSFARSQLTLWVVCKAGEGLCNLFGIA